MESSRYAHSSETSYEQHVSPTTDEFAQTRAPDNLFDDDFDPVEEPEVTIPHVVEAPIDAPTGPNRQRAAGRGARRGGNNAERATPANAPTSTAPDEATAAAEAPRTEAVRGDRSKTGGIKKTKLTEEELSARMEAIKLKNATLEAAHARAEADEASFNEREAQEQEKRRQERQNRQQMMGEREKNRLRKLKAVGGREWDADKAEMEAAENANRSQFRRGAFGGVTSDRQSKSGGLKVKESNSDDTWGAAPAQGTVGSSSEDTLGAPAQGTSGITAQESWGAPAQELRGDNRGRGRGRGGGRGQSRGQDRGGGTRQQSKREQVIPKPEDFPALGGNGKAKDASSSGWGESVKASDVANTGWGESAPGKGASWAEEME